MFNIEKAHMILDEVVSNGEIVETNRNRILAPVHIVDQAAAKMASSSKGKGR
jgi:hypothetical protein